jgi:hypothetical protein
MSWPCRECYDILKDKYGLDCPYNCDYKQMKKAVKKLYFQHHPDRGGDAEIFKEVRGCIELVIDQECTKKYKMPWCDMEHNKRRRGYDMPEKCVKGKVGKTYTDKCPLGHYLRRGYSVKEKCEPRTTLTGLGEVMENIFNTLDYLKILNAESDRKLTYWDPYIFPEEHPPEGYVKRRFNGVAPLTEKDMPYEYNKYKFDPRASLNHERFIEINEEVMEQSRKDGFYYRYVKDRRKPCDGGEENRSLKSGRCLKPCKEGEVRNPDNSKCIRIKRSKRSRRSRRSGSRRSRRSRRSGSRRSRRSKSSKRSGSRRSRRSGSRRSRRSKSSKSRKSRKSSRRKRTSS